ncbi:DUF4168 domain-containing protein [Alteromonas antoniana]|uniref:DUF4168 domain-containing protein n=1 Tax=Alteromonas antoniana TaxID=2803813 RepID=UPI001C474062|nr:DUF4168 domain-containing protein [Alteromonas antoniana]
MKLIKQTLLTAVLTTGLASGAALAQQQNTQMPAPDTQATKRVQVTEQQVENFVDAYVSVQFIGQEYQAKIQSAGDQEKALKLQKEARGKMETAIADSGMEVEKYREISLAANQNKALRSRIAEKISAELEARQQAQKADS